MKRIPPIHLFIWLLALTLVGALPDCHTNDQGASNSVRLHEESEDEHEEDDNDEEIGRAHV